MAETLDFISIHKLSTINLKNTEYFKDEGVFDKSEEGFFNLMQIIVYDLFSFG